MTHSPELPPAARRHQMTDSSVISLLAWAI